MCVSNSLVFFCLHSFVFVVYKLLMSDLYDDHTDAVVGLLLGWNKKRHLKKPILYYKLCFKTVLGGKQDIKPPFQDMKLARSDIPSSEEGSYHAFPSPRAQTTLSTSMHYQALNTYTYLFQVWLAGRWHCSLSNARTEIKLRKQDRHSWKFNSEK